jgi:branched-chain amino acid transport system ATP-binding protein
VSAAEPCLEVRGVTMRFGGLKALAAFDLALRPGELVGLIGPNGAGKTTAFNAITGVYVPTEGEVRVGGEVVNGRRPHEICARGVARTFQNIRLFKELTALDNVRIACHAGARSGFFDALLLTGRHRSEEARIVARAEEYLAVMGLPTGATRWPAASPTASSAGSRSRARSRRARASSASTSRAPA